MFRYDLLCCQNITKVQAVGKKTLLAFCFPNANEMMVPSGTISISFSVHAYVCIVNVISCNKTNEISCKNNVRSVLRKQNIHTEGLLIKQPPCSSEN